MPGPGCLFTAGNLVSGSKLIRIISTFIIMVSYELCVTAGLLSQPMKDLLLPLQPSYTLLGILGWKWRWRMAMSPWSTVPDPARSTVTPSDSSPHFTWNNICPILWIMKVQNILRISAKCHVQKDVRIHRKALQTHWACLFHWLTANLLVKHSLISFLPRLVFLGHIPSTSSPLGVPSDLQTPSQLCHFLASLKAVLGCS